MRVSYSPDYYVPLPDGHPFPMGKFPSLHDYLIKRGTITSKNVVQPRPAAWSDLLRMHSRTYLSALSNGMLSRQAEREMGLPWSDRLVHRSRLAVQGTLNAAMMALEDGLAGNLAGGTHHAYPSHGEGFCVLNDVAIAIRTLQASHWINRSLIVDLDVHQGNGNAAFFADDPYTYTFSMHGAQNYPFHKPPSSRDVGLPDHIGNDEYVNALKMHLPLTVRQAKPDIVFYLAGIDVAQDDRYGRMALSRSGIRQRDRFVIQSIRDLHLPLVLLLSGGYADTPKKTAQLHAICFEEAIAYRNGQP